MDCNVHYRNQWPGLKGTYQTTSIGVQYGFGKFIEGVGIIITNDIAGEGTISTTGTSIPVSKHFKLSESSSLFFGIQAGFYQKTIDWSKLTFGDMIDNKQGFIAPSDPQSPNTTIMNIDFASGLHFNWKGVDVGGAVFHIFEPDEAFINPGTSPLPRRFNSYISYALNWKGFSFVPMVYYSKQNDFESLNYSGTLSYGIVRVMIGGRMQDAFIGGIGLNYKAFDIAYTYDQTISKLTNEATHGSHEFGLIIRLGKDRQDQLRKAF